MATTPNFGFPQPAASDTGWGTGSNTAQGAGLNVALSVLDGLPHHTPNQLVRYVDYANGSDAASTARGLGPGYAYKTIQAAYNELKTTAAANYTAFGTSLGVGRICLLPGDHDVGTHFLVDSTRPVELIGMRQGYNSHATPNSGSRIVTSSSAATEMIRIVGTANAVGRGMTIQNCAFIIDQTNNSSLGKVIYATNMDNLHILSNSVTTLDNSTNLSCVFVWQEYGGPSADNAWFRIIDNHVSRVSLWKAATNVTATGFNRGSVLYNECFYGGTLPMLHLDADVWSSTFAFNNFEGAAIAVQLGPNGNVDRNVFINNGGEGSGAASADSANPYYEILVGSGSHFIGGYCFLSAGTNGIWIRFATNAYNNTVYGPYDATGQAGKKGKLIDNSTYGNTVVDPRFGTLARRIKTGTAPTIGDSDFASTPPDGVWGLTHGSTGPVDKFWARVNGAWKSVALT